MLDDQHRVVEPIMPFEDLTADPRELIEVEDLGLVAAPKLYADRIAFVCELMGATSFAVVWERQGGDRFTRRDLAWASDFADEAARLPVRLRAQFLLHSTGLRQLTTDDYA